MMSHWLNQHSVPTGTIWYVAFLFLQTKLRKDRSDYNKFQMPKLMLKWKSMAMIQGKLYFPYWKHADELKGLMSFNF